MLRMSSRFLQMLNKMNQLSQYNCVQSCAGFATSDQFDALYNAMI